MDIVTYQFVAVVLFVLPVVGVGAIFNREVPPEDPDKKYPNRTGPDIDSMRIVYAAWLEYKRVKNNEMKKRCLAMGCKD